MPATVSQKFDVVKLRRRVCRENFYDFCLEFWSEIVAETPVWNWHIRVMARELQKVAERMFRFEAKEYDLIFNVPPGTSKSTIGSILFPAWLWTRLPSCRYLGGSYDADLSMDLGNKTRRLVKSDKYKETFPEIEIAQDQDTKGYFGNTLKGERRATSTGASIIGRHAHIQVVDDPINPAGVRSALELASANVWMQETLPSRCVNQSVTPMVLIMQRLGIDDPTGTRLARTGGVPVKHICLPAEVSEMVKPPILKNKYKHGLLEPVRLPAKVLESKKEELGTFGYAGQFEQRPMPLTGGMFQPEKLVILPRWPLLKDFMWHKKIRNYVWRWWDKAATAGGGAYTAGVLMGRRVEIPQFVIFDVIRVQVNTAARERLIVETAENDRDIWGDHLKIGLEQEPGSSGVDSSTATVANLAGFNVLAERPTGSKEVRADPFSTQVNKGNVALVAQKWNKAYIDEMTYFGELAKYKDQIDASSGAFKYLTIKKIIVGAGGF